MPISGIIQKAPSGLLGFDVNADVSQYAGQFAQAGYQYCIRYIPFSSDVQDPDLTETETNAILAAGMSLMVVQHAPYDFAATAELGAQFGEAALQYLQSINVPRGSTCGATWRVRTRHNPT